MAEEVKKEKAIEVTNTHNEFELAVRMLSNEIIAFKLSANNFSGKMIVWSILLMFFTFMILEVFGVSALLGIPGAEDY